MAGRAAQFPKGPVGSCVKNGKQEVISVLHYARFSDLTHVYIYHRGSCLLPCRGNRVRFHSILQIFPSLVPISVLQEMLVPSGGDWGNHMPLSSVGQSGIGLEESG